MRLLCGSINVRERPWASKRQPIDYQRCCTDRLNAHPESGHRVTRLACPLCANRVLTRRSKSTASLPGPMLINCTQTESMPLEEDHALALGRLETALCQRVKLESSGAIFMSAKRPPMSI